MEGLKAVRMSSDEIVTTAAEFSSYILSFSRPRWNEYNKCVPPVFFIYITVFHIIVHPLSRPPSRYIQLTQICLNKTWDCVCFHWINDELNFADNKKRIAFFRYFFFPQRYENENKKKTGISPRKKYKGNESCSLSIASLLRNNKTIFRRRAPLTSVLSDEKTSTRLP